MPFSIVFNMQVDTVGELDMKYRLHECYVYLKQFTEAIQTVRYLFAVLCRLQGSKSKCRWFSWMDVIRGI